MLGDRRACRLLRGPWRGRRRRHAAAVRCQHGGCRNDTRNTRDHLLRGLPQRLQLGRLMGRYRNREIDLAVSDQHFRHEPQIDDVPGQVWPLHTAQLLQDLVL
jgi:hypothetical protein